MSANNWAKCPFCTKNQREHVEALKARADRDYGEISRAEYVRLEEQIAGATSVLKNIRDEFAEYYEVYGVETGTVTIDYSGECRTCGAQAEHSAVVEVTKS